MSDSSKPAPGLIDRTLRIFGDARAGEGITVLLMCLSVYLLLVAYYILKTAREPLILLAGKTSDIWHQGYGGGLVPGRAIRGSMATSKEGGIHLYVTTGCTF